MFTMFSVRFIFVPICVGYITLVVITMFSVRFIFVRISVGYITLVVMQMVLLYINLRCFD